MTPEPQQPQDNDSEQKPRKGGGLFLFVFLMILVALVVFGSKPETRTLSMDELWVQLYTGQVKTISVNEVGSAFEAEMSDGQTFKVPVGDARMVKSDVERIQAKSASMQTAMPVERFLADVESGAIVPQKGYQLRIIQLDNPEDPNSAVIEQQRFFVDYSDAEGAYYAELETSDPRDAAFDSRPLLELFQQYDDAEVESLTFNAAAGLKTVPSSGWTTFLVSFGPILLFIVLFWFLFMRQMKGQGQGLLSFGRSRGVVYNREKRTGVTFDDVAGIEEAKDEVSEICEFLRNPEKFTRLGGRIPRGVMLVGPPGTGKTLLAKAIAGEADVPFISISGSDFVEMFVGVGASRVRDLFEQARKEAPCIIFLDEIDAVGRKRGSGMGGGNDEREQTLNAILVEMDGFSTDDNIIVIAATNRPDVLDAALLRPGRFDREITIDLPDVAGREKILDVHTRTVKLDPSVDLQIVARGTPGFSGAELAALVNEAAIIAAMLLRQWVTQSDLEEARDKVRFGREKKSHVMEEEDKLITAYHEAGHAVVNAFMEHSDPVHKVTIIPRGNYGGATFFLPEKDRMHLSRKRILDDICVGFGGRVAEEIYCDDITTGASSDIQGNTHRARLMITHWGMSETLGPVNFGERAGRDFLGNDVGMGREHSPETQRLIDLEISGILDVQLARARKILKENDDLMERVAKALMIYETILKEEFLALVDGADPETLREKPKQAPGGGRDTPPPVPAAPAPVEPTESTPPTPPPAEGDASEPGPIGG